MRDSAQARLTLVGVGLSKMGTGDAISRGTMSGSADDSVAPHMLRRSIGSLFIMLLFIFACRKADAIPKHDPADVLVWRS